MTSLGLPPESMAEIVSKLENCSSEERELIQQAISKAMQECKEQLARELRPLFEAMAYQYRVFYQIMEDKWYDACKSMDQILRWADTEYAQMPPWDEGFEPKCASCGRVYSAPEAYCYPELKGDALLPEAYCMNEAKEIPDGTP